MCEPTTTAILLGTSAAISAYSAYQGQQAANEAADYNANINRENARIAKEHAEIRAKDAGVRYADNKERLDYSISGIKGSQKVGAAASGVMVDKGSMKDIQDDTDYLGSLDAMTLRRNFEMEARGYKMQGEAEASNYLAQARLAEMSKGDPMLSGFSSLLSGAANTTAAYYGAKGRQKHV